MKVSIFENPTVTENHAEIYCQSATNEILWAAGLLENTGKRLMGIKDGAETPLSISDIFYFEAVEKRTFACLQKEVFEVFLTLKEAEERFGSLGFVRISKSVVVNLYRVRSVKNDFEMRALICLDNQETLIISRHYRAAFFSAVFSLIGIAVFSQSYRLDGLSPLRAGAILYLITLVCVLGIVWLYGRFRPLHPDAFRDIFFSFSILCLLLFPKAEAGNEPDGQRHPPAQRERKAGRTNILNSSLF